MKYRPEIRYDPGAILECLRKAFGNKESVTLLQQRFFERQQKDKESIRDYSYALLQLFDDVEKRDSNVFPDKQRTLCDQFANNLLDPLIRKKMKQLVRRNPTMEFFTLRDEAIEFSEEEEHIARAQRTDAIRCDKSQSDLKGQSSLNTESSEQSPEASNIDQ